MTKHEKIAALRRRVQMVFQNPADAEIARGKDYIGAKNNITFWIENCAVRRRRHVRFGSKADIGTFAFLTWINVPSGVWLLR